MERLVSASLAEVLDRVAPSIAAGAVNVFSIEAIRERSDDRWPRKREQVVSFVERAFSRLCQPGDLIAPLNDTEFVTIQPNASPAAGLGLSASVLKETLEFFLGAAAREDIRLFQVTSYRDGELGVQAVAPGRMTSGDPVDLPSPAAGPKAGPLMEELTRLAQPHRVKLRVGSLSSLDVTLTAEPVWNASARAVVSYLLHPTAHLVESADGCAEGAEGEVSPTVAADLAVAIIERGAELLDGLSVRIALHLPLSYRALAFSTARYRVLHALRDLPAGLRKFLILDVVDLPQGLPPGRLAEVVSTLAPHGRAVLGRADIETGQVAGWRGCGLNGVSVDCSGLVVGDRQALLKLSNFVRAAQVVARPCAAYRIPSRALLMSAWAAGCTHLSGASVSIDTLPLPGPIRFEPIDLFAADLRALDQADPEIIPELKRNQNR